VKAIEPEVIGHLNLSPEYMNLVRTGLHAAVNWETGTAHDNFDVPGIDASGKTGTAEFCDRYPQCLDREGRVRTSHAWFASYAPTNNPEIVTIVFIYGGEQGSFNAIPVTNKILRHYFNIQDEDELEDQETDQLSVELEPETAFTARFLGADVWNQAGASIFGFVLDQQGQGVGEVTVEVVANNGVVMAQAVSGQTGQFDLNNLDVMEVERVTIRLADYANAEPLQLDIAQGLRYMMEFKVKAIVEPAVVVDFN
jgi:protocatechuate 3,4-dioxygenase beta subunit